MLCKTAKFILAVLLICAVALPISIIFGSTIALIAIILGLVYILEK